MSLPKEEELDVLLEVPQGEVFDVCVEQAVFLVRSCARACLAPVVPDVSEQIQSSRVGLAYLGLCEAADEVLF